MVVVGDVVLAVFVLAVIFFVVLVAPFPFGREEQLRPDYRSLDSLEGGSGLGEIYVG